MFGFTLLSIVAVFVAGLVVGWIFLPEPAIVRKFFVWLGWAKPPAPPPAS